MDIYIYGYMIYVVTPKKIEKHNLQTSNAQKDREK